jgi:peptidylprolyl isomerase
MNAVVKFSLAVGIGFVLFFSLAGIGVAQTGDAALGEGLFARISTARGEIVVRLEYQKVPLTVCNFVALAEGKMTAAGGRRYYDGLTFHRVISRANGDTQDFMIQGGDPLGNGSGGPGYRFPDEIDPSLKHDKPGILSMANAGPNTNGSQFFITIVPTPWLDGMHTVFGQVVEGQNVLNRIRQGDRMDRVTIIRNGAQANAFRADQAAFDALRLNAESAAAARTRVQRDADIALIDRKYPGAVRAPSGLRWIREKAGTGPKPARGSTAVVNMKGFFLSGESFDNSDLTGGARDIPVGNYIPGLDEALMDMSAGEKRTVIVPPELAFGDRELKDQAGRVVIPPNSFLVFEIELLRIR